MALTTLMLISAIVVFAQVTSPLVGLTVRPDRLPKGCRLDPLNRTPGAAIYPGMRENPWVGSRPRTGALIRLLVDGPAGPTQRPTRAELLDRLAEDVIDSYAARYLAADGSEIEVYAVRFKDAALTAAAAMNRLDGTQPLRIVLGDVAVRLTRTGDWRRMAKSGEECLAVIRDHIASVKRASTGP